MSAKGAVRLVLPTRAAVGEPKPALTVSLLPTSSLVSLSFQKRPEGKVIIVNGEECSSEADTC